MALLGSLVELFVPVECAGCAYPGTAMCRQCFSGFAGGVEEVSNRTRYAALPVFSAASYEGSNRDVIVALKRRGRHDVIPALSLPLAASIAAAAESAAEARVALVPVPSSRASTRRRGYRVVEGLTHAAAARLGESGLRVEVAEMLVARRRRRQSGLGARERRANAVGGVALRGSPQRSGAGTRPRGLILVDDVVTTGATLVEAARVLAACGFPVLAAAVLADRSAEQPMRN